MANNNFKAFAAAAGANVMPQADYESLAALLTGFVSGTAQSAQVNKALRQSSIMSAVLAQFIVDLTGQDAIDDGTTTTLLANLKAAVQAQSAAVVGQARNVVVSVAAASSTATLSADEIVVGTALGGRKYLLNQFSKTVNLAIAGAGGMDSGSAPASGYVALYAIYNPATGASAMLATNATNAVAPNVYGGANMPAGYTASALVSVWPMNGSGQFAIGLQTDRSISILPNVVLNSNTSQASLTALSIAGAVPKNAVSVTFRSSLSSSTTGWSGNITISPAGTGIALQTVGGSNGAANSALYGTNPDVGIVGNSQQVFYICSASPGTPTYGVNVLGYKF